MSFVDLAPDHRLFYQSFEGREDRPWLIFLHEGLGSVAQWKNFPERICRRTDCPALLYDRPGHGRSPARSGQRDPHYLHDLARDELPRLIAALIPEQDYILIGHSDGGSIALIHAADQPAHLRGLVTIAAHAFVEPCTLEGIRKAKESFAQGRMVGLTRYHGDHTETLFRTWADTWLSPAFADWSIIDLLPRVQVPVIVLQGRDDQYGSPAQVDAIVAGVGGTATPLVLDDCGHAPHMDFPALLLDLTSCFVNRVRVFR